MPEENNALPLNTELLASRLAREVARDLVPLDTILERNKISEDDYQRIIQHPLFAQRLQEELEIWSASTPMAIVERIGAKAATMIEESLVEVYGLIHDKNQPMAAKIEALKWASRISGIGEREAANAPALGERVRFNIYIGDKQVSFDKQVVNEKVIEGTSVLVDKDPNL